VRVLDVNAFKQDFEPREVILDHLIHSGSNEYALILTDGGNVHIYHLYRYEETNPHSVIDAGLRGTIQVTRGSLGLNQDPVGLYIAVVSPQYAGKSYA